MACHLFWAKPSLESLPVYRQLDTRLNFQPFTCFKISFAKWQPCCFGSTAKILFCDRFFLPFSLQSNLKSYPPFVDEGVGAVTWQQSTVHSKNFVFGLHFIAFYWGCTATLQRRHWCKGEGAPYICRDANEKTLRSMRSMNKCHPKNTLKYDHVTKPKQSTTKHYAYRMYYSDVMPASWRPKSPAIRLVVQ